MADGYEDCKHDEEAPAYFFKVMLGDFVQKMRIPPAFAQNLRNQIGKNMVLQGPNGKGWIVRLSSTNTQLEFRQGWENFVHDHTIELGDFLMFKYICKTYFKVTIFGRSGCEKHSTVFHNQLPSILHCDEENNDQAELEAKQGKKANSSGRGLGRPGKNFGYCHSVAGKKHQMVKSAETETEEKRYQGVYYVSCRRAVTEAERNKALKSASSFTSKKPFCLIIMKPSHVYQGFWLSIPKAFRHRLQLPSIKLEVILVDPTNKEWPVQYLGSQRGGLSGGWRHFSLANNLEEGDVCVFELVDNSKTKLKLAVHIFRVANRCTPYKRMEGTATPDSTALSTNHCRKKMKFNSVAREDLAINLSEKTSGSEQRKNAEHGAKKVQVKKEKVGSEEKNAEHGVKKVQVKKEKVGSEENNTEHGVKKVQVKKEKVGSDSIKQIQGKPAIYERKAGCRRSQRLTQKYSLVECPGKELCLAPSVDGQKSNSTDVVALSRKTTSLNDVNDNGEHEDMMIIWDNNNATHVMVPSEVAMLSQEFIYEGPLMAKSTPLALNPKPEASSLVVALSPKEATSLLDMNVETNWEI